MRRQALAPRIACRPIRRAGRRRRWSWPTLHRNPPAAPATASTRSARRFRILTSLLQRTTILKTRKFARRSSLLRERWYLTQFPHLRDCRDVRAWSDHALANIRPWSTLHIGTRGSTLQPSRRCALGRRSCTKKKSNEEEADAASQGETMKPRPFRGGYGNPLKYVLIAFSCGALASFSGWSSGDEHE